MRDQLETIRAKDANKMQIIKKLLHTLDEPAKLVLTLEPEDRMFFVTTLSELHPSKQKSKFLQVMQFDQSLPHRQGYKRLKRVHLKYNKEFKGQRKNE